MSDEMTVEEAFAALGISPMSDEVEATKAYHALSKKHHPDSPKGDGERHKKLNRAHDLLKQHFKDGQLVPLDLKRTVQVIERDLAIRQASAQAAEFAAATKRFRQRPIQQLKYLSL